MMKRLLLAATAAWALAGLAAPAAAQEEEIDTVAMAAEYASEFQVEPLTPEQAARLPLARDILTRALPEGSLLEALAVYFEGAYLDPATFEGAAPNDALAQSLNWLIAIELEPRKAEMALAIIDPVYREREVALNRASFEATRTRMAALEPLMREALAEVYAIYYDEAQLRDIAAFFATPTGGLFARQQLEVASNGRLSTRIFASPIYWEATMASYMAADPAENFPERRHFADLTAAERERLAALTGQSLGALEAAMNNDWQALEGAE
ncbi:DUF2059 domain-containing protein [Erythrobacter sp. EC-HK427]|uniref:DUF2059 domain-containing protein n=1 Tax=Erythrobacter sp. EC-HK427 TaxID=2038396 RepID=UPI001254CA21|nr:DUF2059 domain-containing protein [Erythrobacter sp. EC-HK427]VVT04423.1 conserved exported hypothetical protein [Erythrobacter sp. EC-HK427]